MRPGSTSAMIAAAAVAVAFTVGCESQPNPVAPLSQAAESTVASSEAGGAALSSSASGGSAEINQQLAQLRRVTAQFHDLDAALAAGFVQLTGCLELPGVGGMGFHYGLPSRIDATLSVLEPEVLMYEQRGGKLHLTGVEYLLPYALWTEPSPPTLLGQTFHRNDEIGMWILHAWIWKANPDGIFANWNPNVKCE
jgi:hypothetical protein